MAYKDLREWLKLVDKAGGLARVKGVHWDLEANAVSALTKKMVLFDEFPEYKPGYRVLASYTKENRERFVITSNWKSKAEGLNDFIRDWLGCLREFKPCPPKEVKDGPIMENFLTGKDVDVLRFPVPRRHVKEGGRMIGTGHTVITRDPDTGRINMGTYRMQVHDRYTTGFHASEGKDGRIILEKYHNQGKPFPMVAVVGIDEGLFIASTYHLVHLDGSGEMDFAGWLKGQPEEVIIGKFTGLPIPANAEIALEGEIRPGVMKLEGPFAEWTGYSQVKEFPVFEVKNIYHRNDPILTSSMGGGFNPQNGMRVEPLMSALIWDQMEKAGVRGIKGVASYNQRRLQVIAIDNLYAGHSMQAALISSQCHAGCYGGNYTVVVDSNIDPTNLHEVMWQVCMRTEPKRAIQLLEYCWASHLAIQDPSYVQKADYAMRKEKATYISKAIIDACMPLEWDPSWHGEVRVGADLKKRMQERFGKYL